MNDALPTQHLATTTAAIELADELACTNTACTEATTRREECECRGCDGAGHGVEVHRQMQAARARRRQVTATRGAFACLPTPADDDPELAPHRFVAVTVADPDAW